MPEDAAAPGATPNGSDERFFLLVIFGLLGSEIGALLSMLIWS